jgi:hypothetical protein
MTTESTVVTDNNHALEKLVATTQKAKVKALLSRNKLGCNTICAINKINAKMERLIPSS